MRLKTVQQGSKENIAKAQPRPQGLSVAHKLEPRGMAGRRLHLQRTHGNRFVQWVITQHAIKTKL